MKTDISKEDLHKALLKHKARIEACVIKTCSYYRVNPQVVEDLIQECLLDFLNYYPNTLNRLHSLSTYIFLRIKHLISHYIAKEYRRSGILQRNAELIKEGLIEYDGTFNEWEGVPITPVTFSEYLDTKTLTNEERVLLSMHFKEGLSLPEIAKVCGYSSMKAYSILDRSLNKLDKEYLFTRRKRYEKRFSI